jgi:5,5'-dehydrodivanillate O-demethylase oxygenase subunit
MTHRPTRAVRILGESLILFRDSLGGFGLLADRCPHRRASLLFGMPDGDGLRCAYHGWRFDRAGQCTDMPGEPPHAAQKRRVSIVSYPAEELGGLIFAYLGPHPAPRLPRWGLLAEVGSPRDIVTIGVPCNWLQIMANSIDRLHFEWLHIRFHNFALALSGQEARADLNHEIASQRLTDSYEETEYGFAKRTSFRRLDGSERFAILPFVFPTGGQTGLPRAPCLQLRTPIDDENTRQYFYTLYDLEGEMKARLRSQLCHEILDGKRVQRLRIPPPPSEPDYSLLLPNVYQDISIVMSQGRIHDRSQELPGSSDKGVMLYRNLLRRELTKVSEGRDPINVFRKPFPNDHIELPRKSKDGVSSLYPRAAGRPSRNVQLWSPFLSQVEGLGIDPSEVLFERARPHCNEAGSELEVEIDRCCCPAGRELSKRQPD